MERLVAKIKGKDGVTVFGMNPPAHDYEYSFEMLGFAILQSLGIRQRNFNIVEVCLISV